MKKLEEATETAAEGLGQATAAIEAEATARGLLEADAAPFFPQPSPPMPTASMLSAKPPGQQPIVTTTTRGPPEADAPSLSTHPQMAAGQPQPDPESASSQATLASSVSPRVRQTASALRDLHTAGAAGALPATSPSEIITGSKFGAASAAGDDEAAGGSQGGRPGQASLGAGDTTAPPVSGDIGPAGIGTMSVCIMSVPFYSIVVRRNLSPDFRTLCRSHACVVHPDVEEAEADDVDRLPDLEGILQG